MGVNKHRPHVHVLPEDDANRQLAKGFQLDLDFSRIGQFQVLPVVGGWRKVLDCFESDHVGAMERCGTRYMVLLIDFDGRDDRLGQAKAVIPDQLKDRVFVLGVWTEPEDLKPGLGSSFETIGLALARDCREETDTTWKHHLLQHNTNELDRLRMSVRSILFPSAR